MAAIADLLAHVNNSTRQAFETSSTSIINDVSRRNYAYSELIGGRSVESMIKTGPKIEDRIYLKARKSLRKFRPGAVVNTSNPEIGVNHSSHWAFYLTDMTWTSAEEQLNINGFENMSSEGQASMVKDILNQKRMDAMQSAIDGMDDLLLATPNAGTMEHTSGESEDAEVRSLGSFINEEPNGLFSGYSNTNGNFTTIQGLDPTEYPEWVCQQLAYDAADANIGDATKDNHLLGRLRLMRRKVEFKRPKKPFPEATTDGMTFTARGSIWTGEEGYTQLEDVYQQNSDNFVTPNAQDADYGDITVKGTPVIEIPKLDEVTWYDDGSGALTTQAQAAAPGPRYYFINGEFLTPRFHGNKMFYIHETRELPNTVGGYWTPIELWTQLWIHSLRRHGIVYPQSTASSGSSSGS